MNLSIDVKTVTLSLLLTRGCEFPTWEIPQTYKLIDECILDDANKVITIRFNIDSDQDSIVLHNIGKLANDTVIDAHGKILSDQILEINGAWVNDIYIEGWVINDYSTFTPVYSQNAITYAHKTGTTLPTVEHTRKLYANGTWQLSFTRPFFYWYNQILMESINKSISSNWVKQSHLGLADQQVLDKLDQILTSL